MRYAAVLALLLALPATAADWEVHDQFDPFGDKLGVAIVAYAEVGNPRMGPCFLGLSIDDDRVDLHMELYCGRYLNLDTTSCSSFNGACSVNIPVRIGEKRHNLTLYRCDNPPNCAYAYQWRADGREVRDMLAAEQVGETLRMAVPSYGNGDVLMTFGLDGFAEAFGQLTPASD